MLPVTIRRLQVFLAVADAKGFSAAAAVLGISQPSVSVHINALEKKVGFPLFARRNGSSPELTEAGRRFCGYARETLDRAGKIAADLNQAARLRKPRLRCAAHRSVAHSLLPRALAVFSETHPEVELITHTGTFEEVCDLFHNRAVDALLILSPGEIPGLRTEVIGQCQLAIIASPKHPLAAMKAFTPEELSAHPFIAPHRDSHFGRAVENVLMRAGIKNLNVVAQMPEVSLVRELVIAGAGFSCTLRRNVAREIAAGDVVELRVRIPKIQLPLRLARDNKIGSAEIEGFIEVLRQVEFHA
jgi:DNA-binding transcriptional LysR family regulator